MFEYRDESCRHSALKSQRSNVRTRLLAKIMHYESIVAPIANES